MAVLSQLQIMRLMAEFISSLLLVLMGCGGSGGDAKQLQYDFSFGLVTILIVHCFGTVSGAHANPCVSVACWMLSFIEMTSLLIYMTAQFLGAMVGYYLLTLMSDQTSCMTEPNGIKPEQAFGVEFVLTSMLIIGWCGLWDSRGSEYLDSVSVRIGLLVTACCMAGGQLTGASMNPARTLAPAVFENKLDHIPLYFASQFLAALSVSMMWKKLYTL